MKNMWVVKQDEEDDWLSAAPLSVRSLGDLYLQNLLTTETQRTQRLHREIQIKTPPFILTSTHLFSS